MKHLTFITLLLIPFFGIAQTTKPINSFLRIKLGSSPAVVKAALKARGATIDQEFNTLEATGFKNVSLGNRPADVFVVRYVDNKVWEADFGFLTKPEAKTIDYYNDLVNDITGVYGAPNKVTKTFESVYKEEGGEAYAIDAIKTGNAEYKTLWVDSNNNTILIKIETDLFITLQYQDYNLLTIAIKKIKAKEKADF